MSQLAGDNQIEVLPDGTRTFKKDGYVFTIKPDGTRVAHHANGDQISFQPDGTIVATYACGTKVTKLPDGTRLQEFKDGSSLTVFSPQAERAKIRRTIKRAYRPEDFNAKQSLIKSSEFVLGPDHVVSPFRNRPLSKPIKFK